MTKRLEFDAGHRLLNHESKCANVHGHRYAVEVTITLEDGASLDHAGRIVDFGDVKAIFGGWLDDTMDHTFIAHRADPLLEAISASQKKPVVVMDVEPSAENLAIFFLRTARAMLDVPGVRRVTNLVVYETPTSRAEAT